MLLLAMTRCMAPLSATAQETAVNLFLPALDFELFDDPPLSAASAPAGSAQFRLNPPAVTRLLAWHAGQNIRLNLDLPGARSVEASVDRFDLIGSQRMVCRGHVIGRPGSQVTLALSGDAAAGSVFIPTEGMFQIQYAGQGWQRVTAIDTTQVPSCGVRTRDLTSSASTDTGRDSNTTMSPLVQAAGSPGGPTNAIIDLLIVYTPAARAGAGGMEGISALIDAAVTEANTAFENSEVRARLRLVHSAEVSYSESGSINEDLDALEDDSTNSPLHMAHELRRIHRADLVSMITEITGGPHGLANQMREIEVEFAEHAFSVVQRQYAVAYQSLAHELGHNMGCQHDRETSPTGGAFGYSHALRFEAGEALYHTVMAYQPGLPVPYFSNPDVMFMGVPTGVPEMSTNSANNAKTLNLSAATVARFDSINPTGAPPQLTLISPTNGSVYYAPTVLELVAEASDTDGEIVEVEFYVNGVEVGYRHAPPFSLLWTNATTGTFTFSAEARDNSGWTVRSPQARVTLNFAPLKLDPQNLRRLPDETFQIRVQGIDGQAFRLDASENLVDWLPITTDSLLGEHYDYIDLDATNHTVRFYRVLPVP